MDALIELLKANPNAASAFGSIAGAGAALLALIVSAISVAISVWAVTSQRKHNELSLRPLAEITVADYEDCLRVKVRNHGVGPMIVTSLCVTNGSEARETILQWMPDLPDDLRWSNFPDKIQDRSIAPGGQIFLIELWGDETDETFIEYRDIMRATLKGLVVTVNYTNIYGTHMPARTKSLTWFGRDAA